MTACTVDPDTFRHRCEECGALHAHYLGSSGELECRHNVAVSIGADGWLHRASDGSTIRRATELECADYAVGAVFTLHNDRPAANDWLAP